MRQSTHRLLMIRPHRFRKNEQTSDNTFQKQSDLSPDELEHQARSEFDQFVSALSEHGIHVLVVESAPQKDTPDALFPNNWISFHSSGSVVLYPMKAENRRAERDEEVITLVSNEFGLSNEEIIDLTEFENHDKFLEGTGSMVLDRKLKKAYCAISERADERALTIWCEKLGYTPILFHTEVRNGSSVYHTNVVMAIGSEFAVVCDEVIPSDSEREAVLEQLTQDGKEIISISENQMENFAGNILEVLNEEGNTFIVMSESAKNAFSKEQFERLSSFGKVLSVPLSTIETSGGGSARCMLCEIFLPKL